MTGRGDLTRARLIRATTELVSDIGYANVTTRGIAAAAGVAEGTLYRHFPDKTALFFAAALDRHQEIVEWVATLPARAGSGDLESNLLDCLGRLAGLRADIVPLELAVLADPELARRHPGGLSAATGEAGGPPQYIAAYLRAEQELGRVRPDVKPEHAAVVLLTVLFGLAVAPIPRGTDVDPGLLRAAVQLFVGGIAPGRVPTSRSPDL